MFTVLCCSDYKPKPTLFPSPTPTPKIMLNLYAGLTYNQSPYNTDFVLAVIL